MVGVPPLSCTDSLTFVCPTGSRMGRSFVGVCI